MSDQIRGGIIISEILVDPNGANNYDTDGNGTAASTDEFIELYNTSGAPIDISGLELWDNGSGRWFTFPSGSILAPGARAIVVTGVQSGGSLPSVGANDLTFDAGRGSAILNNGSDGIVIYDPDANDFIQATYNGEPMRDPTTWSGFSGDATRIGDGEDMGTIAEGQSLQRDGDTGDTFSNGTPTPAEANVCFTAGTLILTPQGERAIETLQPGDLVETRDHGAQPVRWIGTKTLSAALQAAHPNLRPIRIGAGALGDGRPVSDLIVSPQHRVLVRSEIARRRFGADEVLVAAKQLRAVPGIDDMPGSTPVTYVHILFDAHEVVIANGAETESLYTGTEALKSVGAAALEEIFTLFPELRDRDPEQSPAGARILLTAGQGRDLARRHVDKGRALLG